MLEGNCTVSCGPKVSWKSREERSVGNMAAVAGEGESEDSCRPWKWFTSFDQLAAARLAGG